ncbi:hypothetical protein Tsubulata_013880 [Turnera subulata]|uniref:MADS-box domain-containing protein n=1 Tax=Turnera subulata TaxID=218843 RepID=A0A9Q0FUA0_9ROSI|nr:hypothetical protein Tsubulata_013880 [Turnera subulata]
MKMEDNKNKNKNGSRKQRRTEIKRIESGNGLYTAFVKRRDGLFRKTKELCARSGGNAVVVVFSPAAHKPHVFGHPSPDSVIHRFLNNDNPPLPSQSHQQQQQQPIINANIVRVEEEEEEGGAGSHHIVPASSAAAEPELIHGWWEEESPSGMDMEELRHFGASLGELRDNVTARIEDIKYRESRLINFF